MMNLTPYLVRYNRPERSVRMSLDPVGRSWVRMSGMMNLAPCCDALPVSLSPY
jgi:hypothetical protein